MFPEIETIKNVIAQLETQLTDEQLKGELVRWITTDEAINFYEHLTRHCKIPNEKVEAELNLNKETVINILDAIEKHLSREQIKEAVVGWVLAREALQFYHHIVAHYELPRAKVEA